MNPELERYFSSARLAPYLLPGETADVAFARYQWNLRLAEALLPSLNYLEVGLRNSLNRIVANLYGADWLLIVSPKLTLSFEDLRNIDNLKDEIQETKGYPANHDDILARLGFGFWVSFFHKRYTSGLWNRGKTPLVAMFPHMAPALCTRELVFARLRTIKALRNRIAHHEPIWKMTPTADEVHKICLEIVSGMSVVVADELARIDRFAVVYAHGLKN
jgi:hypothetical protein